jgi:hypothetical protein
MPAEEALADELPWLRWLPEEERRLCIRELLADLRAGAETRVLALNCGGMGRSAART